MGQREASMSQSFHFPESERTIVFLPFYGEYGFYISSFLRWVHYARSSRKVVCCGRGDEILFPSASVFYYNWTNPLSDSVKCGVRDEYSFGPPRYRYASELVLRQRLAMEFPDSDLVELQEHIPFDQLASFPISFPVTRTMAPYADIVICARRRNAFTVEGDHGRRNYSHWTSVVDNLLSHGLSVAVIGRKSTSYELPCCITASWDYTNSTEVMIDLLRNCRLYIGTDTGPTHLAALLGVPMLLFRNHADSAYNLLDSCIKPVSLISGRYYGEVIEGWNNPTLIVTEALNYLKMNTARLP